jgi:hypothetical protein
MCSIDPDTDGIAIMLDDACIGIDDDSCIAAEAPLEAGVPRELLQPATASTAATITTGVARA